MAFKTNNSGQSNRQGFLKRNVEANFPDAQNKQLANDFWWALLLRGISAILFGILALVWPGLSWVYLIFIAGFYLLFTGLITLGVGFGEVINRVRAWPIAMALGLLELIIALYILMAPALPLLTMIIILAAILIVRGVGDLITAVTGNFVTLSSRILRFGGGIIWMVFGIVLIAHPANTSYAFIIVFGICAIIYGIVVLALALDYHRVVRNSSSR
jgi:uncharacterized membrane protein HdeD (DUF308 family)